MQEDNADPGMLYQKHQRTQHDDLERGLIRAVRKHTGNYIVYNLVVSSSRSSIPLFGTGLEQHQRVSGWHDSQHANATTGHDGERRCTYFPLYRHFSPLSSSFSATCLSTPTMTSALFVRKLRMGNDPESGPVEIGVSDDADEGGGLENGTDRSLERGGRRPLHVASQPASAPMSDLLKRGRSWREAYFRKLMGTCNHDSESARGDKKMPGTYFKSPYTRAVCVSDGQIARCLYPYLENDEVTIT